jgi:archaeosine-15-forming tRNA-guanine transglycosylase
MVTRGPIVPVCVAEQPCDGPAKNVTLAFVRDGNVRRATTNDQGLYRVTLAPGLYSVRLMVGQQVGRGLEPSRARVVVNRVRRVDFSIDTGIR